MRGQASASPAEIGARFTRLGGTFVQSPETLAERFRHITALVFDWDGVFNRGEKGGDASSGFTEADSMGINMLRYAIWRRDQQLPVCAIITGEKNAAAEQFARRERFHGFYYGVKDKRSAMADCLARNSLKPEQVACIFDDINDLAMAVDSGLRVLVRRRASEMLRGYALETSACDYITANESGQYAVRESAELLLGLSGSFEAVIASRSAHDATYRAYFSSRQEITFDVISGASLVRGAAGA